MRQVIFEGLEPRQLLAAASLAGFSHELLPLSQNRQFIATASVGDQVLFAGGDFTDSKNNTLVTDAVDIYDAATGEWSTARLSQPRTNIRQVVVAGTHVLFIGGGTAGWFSGPQSTAIDDFDSVTHQWTATALPHPRDGVTPVAVGARVVFAGGFTVTAGGSQASDQVDIYDTATGTWTAAALAKPHAGLTAAVAGATALFVDSAGGPDADLYDAASGIWSEHQFSAASVAVPVAVGGKLAAFLNQGVDVYDPSSGQWATFPALGGSFYGRPHTVVGTQVAFSGGLVNNSTPYDSEVFDVATGDFTRQTGASAAVPVAVTIGTKAIFAGGSGRGEYGFPSFTDEVDIYDASTRHWTFSATRLSAPRTGMPALSDGSLAVFGPGAGSPYGLPSANVDVYDAGSGVWSSAPLAGTDWLHGSALVDGQLLFEGQTGVDLFTRSRITAPANPSPSTGSGAASAPAQLSWDPSPEASDYDVYLDENKVANVSSNQWTVDRPLAPGHHSWQIVARNAGSFVPGPRWTFDIGLPAVAASPTPANGVSLKTSPPTFAWQAAAGASSYDVYIDGVYFGNVASNHTAIGKLLRGGPHAWRVDARNGEGVTAGLTWTFALPPSGLYASDRALSIDGPIAAVSVGHTALFASDSTADYIFNSPAVELYNTLNGSWSQAALSQARGNMTTATVGTKAIFAGGEIKYPTFSDAVDIFDSATNAWTSATLSVPREFLATATVGDQALFAGGFSNDVNDAVDIYHSRSGTWTTARLSQARWDLAAASAGHFAFFAGGTRDSVYGEAPYTDVVDIYDARRRHWSVAHLSSARARICAVTVGSKILFAGGDSDDFRTQNYGTSHVVDIYDLKTGRWSTSSLPQGASGLTAVVVGNLVVFAGGSRGVSPDNPNGETDGVEIYNARTGAWSTAKLANARSAETVVRLGSRVLIGGGYINGSADGTIDVYNALDNSWTVETMSISPYVDHVAATSIDRVAIFTAESTTSEFEEIAHLFNPIHTPRAHPRMRGPAARYG